MLHELQCRRTATLSWEMQSILVPRERVGFCGHRIWENGYWGTPRAAIHGAAFVCGPVSDLAGRRKTNTLLPLNSEEEDNKGKASLASRNSQCDPWNEKVQYWGVDIAAKSANRFWPEGDARYTLK